MIGVIICATVVVCSSLYAGWCYFKSQPPAEHIDIKDLAFTKDDVHIHNLMTNRSLDLLFLDNEFIKVFMLTPSFTFFSAITFCM